MRNLLAFCLSLPLVAQAPELRSTAADRTALGITIYQNDLAAVRDTRRVVLPPGQSRLAFSDVAATIRPKTAFLLDPDKGVEVVERNFEFNLLSPASLELASLGQAAALRNTRTGLLAWGIQASVPWPRGLMNPHASALARSARLPSAYFIRPSSAVLLKTPEGYESSGASAPIYRSVPDALRASPTLLQTLNADAGGPRELSLLYTAAGLSWQAHYTATLAPDARHLDLAAFATVENESGIDYPDASFQLVAGIPNVVADPNPPNAMDAPQMDATQTTVAVVGTAIGPPIFHEEKLSEYPLFTLDRPVTLRNGQKKQLALFQASNIPVEIKAVISPAIWIFDDPEGYLASCNGPFEPPSSTASTIPLTLDLDMSGAGGQSSMDDAVFKRLMDHEDWLANYRPAVELEGTIQNARGRGLGRALPAGDLDLRYTAPEGVCIPMGEISVDQTPPGESMDLDLGPARGLSAERRVLSLRRMGGGKSGFWELEVAVTLTNQSRRPMRAIFREPIYANWLLERTNVKGRRSGQNAYDFIFTSKPGSRFTLKYKVKAPTEDPPNPS